MAKPSNVKKKCSSPSKPLTRQTSSTKRSQIGNALQHVSPNRQQTQQQQQQPIQMSSKHHSLSISKRPSHISKRSSTTSTKTRATIKHHSKRHVEPSNFYEWRANTQYGTKVNIAGNDIVTATPLLTSQTFQTFQSYSTFSSSLSPTSSTSPNGFNTVSTTIRREELQKQQQLLPDDVAEYFETNNQAWGYLRSLTDGIKSYGLDHFGRPSRELNVNLDQNSWYPYTPSGFLIGSGPSCSISIPNLGNRHSFIYMRWHFENNTYLPQLLIFDCSNNGVLLDEKPVAKGQETKLLRHAYSPGEKSQVMYIQNGPTIQLNGETPEANVRFQLHVSAQKIECYAKNIVSINELYQYDPTTKIGKGAYGDVYKAVCKSTKKVVALKKMEMNGRPINVCQALCRETAINVFLKPHPCIIRYENVMEESCEASLGDQVSKITRNVYIVMEHGKDGDLFDLVNKAPLIPEDDVIVIFDQLFHAISHLHSQGIAHRDLKLENIVVLDRDQYQVKLCDFGVAAFERIGHTFETYCGTLEYSAPEIFSNERKTEEATGYTKAVDIWSLGIMLYNTLSKRSPYPASCCDKETMYQYVCGDEFPDFSGKEWHRVSDQAMDLLRNMLALDPQQRYDINQLLAHPWSQRAQVLKNRNASLAEYLRVSS